MDLHEEMNVWIQKNENAEMHFHPDIEIDYVVEGELQVTVKDVSYHLKKNDVILLNSGILHGVKSKTENTILCCVKFSCKSMAEMSGKESLLFFCNSTEEDGQKYQELKKIFYELIYNQVQKAHRTACMKRSVLYKLLDQLLEEFQMSLGTEEAGHVDDIRMMQILQYVNQNFQYSVSLTELADRLYMSKSTLSRFFKKQTGIYFGDYVNHVRFKYALEDLLYSNKNITKIAVDCGFSNPSAFNKVFREKYGISPTEYRVREGRQEKKQEKPVALNVEIIQELKEKLAAKDENQHQNLLNVNVDMRKRMPFPKTWGRCINIGSAYNLSVANLQYHTLYLKEHLGFCYGRIWSILSQKLMISDGKTRGYYNYDKIDGVLDFMVSNHIVPFLDFGNRPDTAIYEPGRPVFCEKEYIEFNSKAIWQDLMKDFILHITNRYGANEVSNWLFEFSYDPAHEEERTYYKDDNFRYFDVFYFAFETIKARIPEAKVGGPMGEMEKDYEFVSTFLAECRHEGIQPDFVSFMLFPYHTQNRNNEVFSERAVTASIEADQVKMMRDILRKNEMENCALYITEWNNTLSNRNYLNDSCFRAAYILKKISEIADQTDMLAIWMASDWMSSYYDTVKIANGGSGLLTKDSIRKPAYFAFQFLCMMGTSLVDKGRNYLITENGKGEYYVLCFHYKWFGINYFIREEGVKEPERAADIFENEDSIELRICMEHVTSETGYIIKKRMINEESGSVLSEWKNFLYSRSLSSPDIKYIRENCFPRMCMEKVTSRDGCLQISTVLQPHEIALLHIYEE